MTIVTLNPETGCTPASNVATTNQNHVGDATDRPLGEQNTDVGIRRWLLKFAALSDGTIPAGATIVSATMSLRAVSDRSSFARTCRVYRTKRAWVTNQATWNIYATSNNWSTAGGFHADDCEQTDIGSRAFTATETLNEFKDFPLTPSAIQEIVSGAWTNNGFLLKFDTEANDGYIFNTLGNATAENRPKLVIEYTLPGVLGAQIF